MRRFATLEFAFQRGTARRPTDLLPMSRVAQGSTYIIISISKIVKRDGPSPGSLTGSEAAWQESDPGPVGAARTQAENAKEILNARAGQARDAVSKRQRTLLQIVATSGRSVATTATEPRACSIPVLPAKKRSPTYALLTNSVWQLVCQVIGDSAVDSDGRAWLRIAAGRPGSNCVVDFRAIARHVDRGPCRVKAILGYIGVHVLQLSY